MSVEVSVVITTHNYGRFISECIESVLSQNLSDFEVIVLDDASTDDTEAVVGRYSDSRLTYHRNAKNLGQTPTFNAALALAGGRYVTKLDADDFLRGPNSIASRLALFTHNSKLGIAFGNADRVDESGRLLKPQYFEHLRTHRGVMSMQEVLFRHLKLLRANFHPGSALVRRDALVSVGLFDESMYAYEDWDLWLRIGRSWQMDYVPHSVLATREHTSGQSTRNVDSGRAYQDLRELMSRAFSAFPEDTAELSFEKLYARNCLRILGARVRHPRDIRHLLGEYRRLLKLHPTNAFSRANMHVLAKAGYVLSKGVLRPRRARTVGA